MRVKRNVCCKRVALAPFLPRPDTQEFIIWIMEKDLSHEIDYDLKFVELGARVTDKRIQVLTRLAEQTLARARELQRGESSSDTGEAAIFAEDC